MHELEDVTEELGFQFIRSKKDAKKTNEIKKEIEKSYSMINQKPPYKVLYFQFSFISQYQVEQYIKVNQLNTEFSQ